MSGGWHHQRFPVLARPGKRPVYKPGTEALMFCMACESYLHHQKIPEVGYECPHCYNFVPFKGKHMKVRRRVVD